MATLEDEIKKIPERIERGIKFNDEHFPGWRSMINVHTLDLYSCTSCVWGQIGGHYTEVLQKLFPNVGLYELNPTLTDLGVCVSYDLGESVGIDSDIHKYYEELTLAWKRRLSAPEGSEIFDRAMYGYERTKPAFLLEQVLLNEDDE